MEIKPSDLVSLLDVLKGASDVDKSHSYVVGKKYLIRTVTLYHIGLLKQVTDTDLVLEDASWVANTGRFYDALNKGILSEVEPFVDDAIVSRAAIVDATVWNHNLPRTQI